MEIPYLPYPKLRPIADDFLTKYHPSGQLPIPIEPIIDNRFAIDIVPTPGLHRAFDIDAFITSDFSEIHVDEFVYESRPKRYRFSLAHELSHLLLHQDVFSQMQFSTVTEWRSAVKSVPDKEYGYLEFQANSLAGLILVPPTELGELFRQATARAKAAGIELNDTSDAAREIIESYLSESFDVSTAVIHRRVEFDSLWDS